MNRIQFKVIWGTGITAHSGPGASNPGYYNIPCNTIVTVVADGSTFNDGDGFRWWQVAPESVENPDRAGYVPDLLGPDPANTALRLMQFVGVSTV